MSRKGETLRIALKRRTLWLRALRDGAIGLVVLGVGLLAIAPGLIGGGDLGSVDLLLWYLFVGAVFAVGAWDAVRVARLRDSALEIGPKGFFDHRIQHRVVPWDKLERADWLESEGRAAILCLWPVGPIDAYRKPVPLWGYFGMVDALRKMARRAGYEFGPLNIDLASLDIEPERVRQALHAYWGEPRVRPLDPMGRSARSP